MSDDPDGGDDPSIREYDKLVRDRIPETIRATDETPVTRRVDGEELQRYLLDKLVEEATEARDAGSDPAESVDAELADLAAVLDTLVERRGRDRVARLRREKRGERGEFDDGVVLERVREDG
ncbi:nucleoside triphosphate pyrophosphohydrolase [Halobaculum litoreum]|uniref:Nucleoside triphosphate pyrophosphohydrolase n=1 Tax=Halobaculum litoreum TaxID=3031998 RepID=A0ABD5XLN1_9EURY|nr:nucleoside triphosphate pyrophosphohydrolase [Halobaculum sp. DT92]